MKTRVYVDGFNLYYGALKARPSCKWLNLVEMCRRALPSEYELDVIKYFTASLKANERNPDAHSRQQIYLRALQTLPTVEIIKGNFQSANKIMPLVSPDRGVITSGIKYKCDEYSSALVLKMEEKGSDVNLAVHAVTDGFLGLYDAAVIITNDSDLTQALKVIKADINKPVGIINPHPERNRVRAFDRFTDFQIQLSTQHLEESQFPDKVITKKGSVKRPDAWK